MHVCAGKTLIARQIGKMLNSREPKVVNGPEILNKYVGASEENIRELFKDAEKEQAEKGEDSDLHVIIFDEIDAICKQRGSVSSGTGVHDTVVNQLLTKIDGVDSLNNILLIGKHAPSAYSTTIASQAPYNSLRGGWIGLSPFWSNLLTGRSSEKLIAFYSHLQRVVA